MRLAHRTPARQPWLQPSAVERGAQAIYEIVRRFGDPDFEQLSRRQQLAFHNAVFLGAATVDMDRIIGAPVKRDDR